MSEKEAVFEGHRFKVPVLSANHDRKPFKMYDIATFLKLVDSVLMPATLF